MVKKIISGLCIAAISGCSGNAFCQPVLSDPVCTGYSSDNLIIVEGKVNVKELDQYFRVVSIDDCYSDDVLNIKPLFRQKSIKIRHRECIKELTIGCSPNHLHDYFDVLDFPSVNSVSVDYLYGRHVNTAQPDSDIISLLKGCPSLAEFHCTDSVFILDYLKEIPAKGNIVTLSFTVGPKQSDVFDYVAEAFTNLKSLSVNNNAITQIPLERFSAKAKYLSHLEGYFDLNDLLVCNALASFPSLREIQTYAPLEEPNLGNVSVLKHMHKLSFCVKTINEKKNIQAKIAAYLPDTEIEILVRP